MFGFLNAIRSAVKTAILGGVADALGELHHAQDLDGLLLLEDRRDEALEPAEVEANGRKRAARR